MRSSLSEYREFQDGEHIAGTRYRVVGLIGVGGMGTVYEVEHIELGKRFVLKALLRELARRQDLVIRLRNEWRALGRLEHPNIVTVTDAGTSASGVPFYVMERLDGETLAQRMRKVRRFPVADAVELAAGMLDGLFAAHEIGVVHRDVKPPNIFLVAGDQPKVLDFGVAKIADDPGVVTARGIAVGTPRYMSPEQARGERVDGRADVYSVGLILYELISGESPFQHARDANELILSHLALPAPPLSRRVPGISPELDAVVLKLLEKQHTARPATAREAARELRSVLSHLTDFEIPQPVPRVRKAREPRTDDTTRPDGIALRSAASASAAPGTQRDVDALWLADTSLAPRAEASHTLPSEGALPSLRAVVTSLDDEFTQSSRDEPTSPGGRSRRSSVPSAPPGATLPTEVLSAPSPAATRTRIPSSSGRRHSETPPPIARAHSSRSRPPSAAAERRHALLWGGAALLVTTGVGFLGVIAYQNQVAATAARLERAAASDQKMQAFPAPKALPATPVTVETLTRSDNRALPALAPSAVPLPSLSGPAPKPRVERPPALQDRVPKAAPRAKLPEAPPPASEPPVAPAPAETPVRRGLPGSGL